MVTINPISQMRKVKSVSGGNNAITLKTQSDAHSEALNATQGKIRLNPLLFKLAQFTRQFELIKQANARCKETFPDCFHHKHKLAEELNELAEILRGGQALIQQHKAAMSAEEKAQAKRFNQAVDYLTFHFNAVCEDVAALDKAGNAYMGLILKFH